PRADCTLVPYTTLFRSQTLIKGIDMWKGIRSGIADIGWCVQGYWPEQTPLSDVMSLPFLPLKSAEQGGAILWQLYEKFPSIQKRSEEHTSELQSRENLV